MEHEASITCFTNVNVVLIAEAVVQPQRTVVVEGETIRWIGPADRAEWPRGARIIDGGGYLIPGLCDMHVHIVPHIALPRAGADPVESAVTMAAEYLRLFLAHGVTTVRNMAGSDFILNVRRRAEEGRFPSPRIFTSGPILETVFSAEMLNTYACRITSPEAAVAEVERHVRLGYDFLKVYDRIDEDIYDSLVRAGREAGLRVVGHVPHDKGLQGVLKAQQDSIEHFRGFDVFLDSRPPDQRTGERYSGWRFTTHRKIAEVAEQVAASPTWNVPTLMVEDPLGAEVVHGPDDLAGLPWSFQAHLRGLHRPIRYTEDERTLYRDNMAARHTLLRELDRLGGKLMTGSDCPGARNRLIPGRSLLSELEAFVAAGVSPHRALRAATLDAAIFLGRTSEFGEVAEGRCADLVLLEDDPLADISAVRRRRGVMARGVWFDADALGLSTTTIDAGWNDPHDGEYPEGAGSSSTTDGLGCCDH